ncbi:hypothetical protein EUX98_g1004 [Antrodiella citrinella]|uniref:ABC transporter domain-containing protein n=1 Tax=Antrodiella citrinella TaxID=2447956 RepID=A0A4S4N2Q0_9APHY|nr:hypothetical protein EUX98_g1004 [Antrodiella citrinella]
MGGNRLSDTTQREDGTQCECTEGWGGVNCNVCKTDLACDGFPIYGEPDSSDETTNMTCYKQGVPVFQNHQACDVTNRKIVDQLDGRKPEVTFSCDSVHDTCQFQFWAAQVESFYCAVTTCNVDVSPDASSVEKKGVADIHEYFEDFIKGPATFKCTTGSGCIFSEDAMNELITTFFGDPYITLQCEGGECLHYSQVPGYVRPPKPDNSGFIALTIAGAGLLVIGASAILWFAARTRSGDFGKIRLPEAETAKLMTDHVPASLHFTNISYTLGNGKTILDNITGTVKPGQIMAIMGASGAGKSTFLDILARRRKRGLVGGQTLVNGREVVDEDFRKVTGFVDQEDTLMSTLTVYETVLYSALLRLPREMSLEAKKYRTLETMNELGILSIKDSRIGSKGHRSISGGEKRRVSIACELVTSPSILFLDEPTSGLDAYNALSVVESLVNLARDYNRTVVFTIHQPRSNIVSLFDQILLLAQGKLIYAGESSRCHEYLEKIGHPCPPGFNLADYLIDMTMQAMTEPQSLESPPTEVTLPADETDQYYDEERANARPSTTMSILTHGQSSTATDETELQTRVGSAVSTSTQFIKRKTSQLIGAITPTSQRGEATISPHLAELVEAFRNSDVAAEIALEITETAQAAAPHSEDALPDVALEHSLTRGRKRASWGTQFQILSGRAFKNLYRDPALLAAHYISSILLALICGLFYSRSGTDIAGFQNRLGLFFFTLALFGFSCLSSLSLFANERILFMRERANGYYSSFTYFSSKILFDILPLRVVPPFVFGGIVYGIVGLVPTQVAFWKFMLVLILFNLAAAMCILLLSIAFADVGVAGLCGTLIMLFNLLFTGLLVNRATLLPAFQWLHTVSFFHAAFEALAVNELRYLQLRQKEFGVDLDVPAATILSMFGLRAGSFWWPNVALLGMFIGGFTVLSYFILHVYVKEKR